jgi:enterochelin esterase family protein
MLGMNHRSIILALSCTCLITALETSAQQLTNTSAGPSRQRTPNDNLKSLEVLSDHRVSFRIYAPKATEVSVTGDWVSQGLGAAGPLKKDESGVWSITVGPLPPDFYSYMLTVDGVRTADPKNALIKPGVASLDNMFLVPGPEASYAENKSVPHGVIRQVWYSSETLGAQRRMHVYTPPGYDQGTERLPVFYLLHGGGDDDAGWSTIGRAGFILDNLLAEGKAKPMIVVMPNGSLPRPATGPGTNPGSSAPEDVAARAALQERFTSELLRDIAPFVEANYRTLPGRENRALAGLSMGGGQALRIFMKQPDQFGYVAIWSAGLFGQKPDEFEERNSGFLKQSSKINEELKLVSICVGDQDFALAGSRSLDAVFTKSELKHEMHVSAGGHTWINWRHYLQDLTPRLFR